MDHYSEQSTLVPTQKQDAQQPLILEYADLINTVQLSVARQSQKDITGALKTDSFKELFNSLNEEDKQDILGELYGNFDSTLINFIKCAVIARRNRIVTIRVEEAEGVHEDFPWETPLRDHLKSTLVGADVYVERVPKRNHSTVDLGAVAVEKVLEPVS